MNPSRLEEEKIEQYFIELEKSHSQIKKVL